MIIVTNSGNPGNQPTELLTMREAAKLARVSERTIYAVAALEGLQKVKIGRSVRIFRTELMRYLKENEK